MKEEYTPSPQELGKASRMMTDEQKAMSKEREATFKAGAKIGRKEAAEPLQKELKQTKGELETTTKDKVEEERSLRTAREYQITQQIRKIFEPKPVSWEYEDNIGRENILKNGENFNISINDVSVYEAKWKVVFLGGGHNIRMEQIPQIVMMSPRGDAKPFPVQKQ